MPLRSAPGRSLPEFASLRGKATKVLQAAHADRLHDIIPAFNPDNILAI
ncbi:MAG TPA: hypothetical protein PKN57_08350 [Saprospiraceae bacterium]|nr:hypothetical protein [Saprospiraceae bacterium]HMX82560.1 hypothetical protein [Saprospiraceae bacterium]HMX86667.1 hypothetical protein [Saprospiraceae bacterium]HMZ73713.1 hypothetical protein [Saprospiraceae bacterium]HNE66706.1 hypothetical protein [Saprospiraceae bacterium]